MDYPRRSRRLVTATLVCGLLAAGAGLVAGREAAPIPRPRPVVQPPPEPDPRGIPPIPRPPPPADAPGAVRDKAPTPSPETVTRAYDIRNLLIQRPDFTDAPDFSRPRGQSATVVESGGG